MLLGCQLWPAVCHGQLPLPLTLQQCLSAEMSSFSGAGVVNFCLLPSTCCSWVPALAEPLELSPHARNEPEHRWELKVKMFENSSKQARLVQKESVKT